MSENIPPEAPETPREESRMGKQAMDTAQQIWLAGLGALAKAQAEGSRVFENLVNEGVKAQKNNQKTAQEQAEQVRDSMETGFARTQRQASETWDRVEKAFEERTQRTLNRLGVADRAEIQKLRAEIEALRQELEGIKNHNDGDRNGPAGPPGI